jgi:hypothetical protein
VRLARMVVLLCVCIGLLSLQVTAQTVDPAAFERVLIPVLYHNVAGGFGSQWTSVFVMHNGADLSATFFPTDCDLDPFSVTPCLVTFSVGAHNTVEPLTGVSGDQPPGRLFYVGKDVAPLVHFELRAEDLSRKADTFGTEIPVVREHDVITDTTDLVGVPTDPRFRDTLRVYDFDGTGVGAVIVTALDPKGVVLGSVDLRLTIPLRRFDPTVDPGYAEISSIAATFPSAATSLVLRIEPKTAGLRYWAFVSVTNNDTQDVTTITPQ